MISISSTGKFKKTIDYLARIDHRGIYSDLDRLARRGVEALDAATPQDTGLTGDSWGYKIDVGRDKTTIAWTNDNVNGTANIAVLLQYGHGTGTGGYVAGYDYINPAMRPIFDEIADAVWKKVTNG